LILSHGSNSQIDITAKGKVGTGKINLADITANFEIVHESNIATSIVAEPNLTPLFEAWGFKFLSKGIRPRFKDFTGGRTEIGEERDELQELGFAKVDYDDYA
jgi:hypothetical protein